MLFRSIASCVTLQKRVDERKKYQAELLVVETEVKKLPADTDAVIGNESKVVRALLAEVKSLATAKDFVTAFTRLADVKTACAAAQKLAETNKETKEASDKAINNTDTATALAEVRKLYEKLKKHGQAPAIAKQLKEIDTKLTEADTALK